MAFAIAVTSAISRTSPAARTRRTTTPRVRRTAIRGTVTPARLGVVTFAVDGASHADQLAIGRTLESSGVAALTTTTLHGTNVMRLCTVNPRTTTDDIDAVLEAIVLHYRG